MCSWRRQTTAVASEWCVDDGRLTSLLLMLNVWRDHVRRQLLCTDVRQKCRVADVVDVPSNSAAGPDLATSLTSRWIRLQSLLCCIHYLVCVMLITLAGGCRRGVDLVRVFGCLDVFLGFLKGKRLELSTHTIVGRDIIHCRPCQGAHNSGKPGNLREFVNSGKLRENSGI